MRDGDRYIINGRKWWTTGALARRAKMDVFGAKAARSEIAMIKVAAPAMAKPVIDRAIQAFGAAGICDDYGLAYMYAAARTLRLADGPDEVHRAAIGKAELAKPQLPLL